MITIISGTNRVDNNSVKIARIIADDIRENSMEAQILSLEEVPAGILKASQEAKYDIDPDFLAFQEKYLFDAEKFIIVMPEYNGSIPGILKLLVDATDVKRAFYHKKACLIGIASGRGGNTRGMDQLTNILNYLKVNVYYNKMAISGIHNELDRNGMIVNPNITQQMKEQLIGFINY